MVFSEASLRKLIEYNANWPVGGLEILAVQSSTDPLSVEVIFTAPVLGEKYEAEDGLETHIITHFLGPTE
jgi:hypothetical protein